MEGLLAGKREKAGSRISFIIDIPKVRGKYQILIQMERSNFTSDQQARDQVEIIENGY
jgi:hypothetical protein